MCACIEMGLGTTRYLKFFCQAAQASPSPVLDTVQGPGALRCVRNGGWGMGGGGDRLWTGVK